MHIVCMRAATSTISATEVEEILLLPSFCVELSPIRSLCVVCRTGAVGVG